MKVEFFRHNIGPAEQQSVRDVLETVFLTTGDRVRQFESDLAAYTGAAHAVGVTSCTAALHLALEAMGIGAGEEVITTPMTFVATSLAIMHAGATPVWVDVEPDTGNIDASRIAAAITPRTGAIIPVHLYGQMCDMKAIRRIADAHGLAVIEDAAHSLEGSRDGVRVGELADAACYSFYATKAITSGEGGAIATDSAELAEKIRLLRTHGISRGAADRYTKRYEHWDLLDIGWKYNMDNIQAAMLIPQLARADQLHRRRAEIDHRYRAGLADVPGLSMPTPIPDSQSGYHLFTIWVPPTRRDEVLDELQARQIGVAVNFRSINTLTKFQERFNQPRGCFPISERIGDSTISIPFFPALRDEQIDYVIDSIRNIMTS